MLAPSSMEQQVMEVIVRSPGTALDDFVLECPNLSWNQVFLVVDRLTRDGTLSMIPQGHGRYAVYLSKLIAES